MSWFKRIFGGAQDVPWVNVAEASKRVVSDLPAWPIKQSLSTSIFELEQLLQSIPIARKGVPALTADSFSKDAVSAIESVHRIADKVAGVVAQGIDYRVIASELTKQAARLDQLTKAARQARAVLAQLTLSDREGRDLENAALGLSC